MSNFTRISYIKNHRNRMVFDGVIQKIICGLFLRHSDSQLCSEIFKSMQLFIFIFTNISLLLPLLTISINMHNAVNNTEPDCFIESAVKRR